MHLKTNTAANKYSDELRACLIPNDLQSFWKTWNLKVCNKNLSFQTLMVNRDDVEIAAIFKSKF